MYTINIDTNLIPFVEKSALADGVSVELWCERKLNGNIKRLMKDVAIDQINSAKTEELDTFVSAVATVKQTFEAAKTTISEGKSTIEMAGLV